MKQFKHIFFLFLIIATFNFAFSSSNRKVDLNKFSFEGGFKVKKNGYIYYVDLNYVRKHQVYGHRFESSQYIIMDSLISNEIEFISLDGLKEYSQIVSLFNKIFNISFHLQKIKIFSINQNDFLKFGKISKYRHKSIGAVSYYLIDPKNKKLLLNVEIKNRLKYRIFNSFMFRKISS